MRLRNLILCLLFCLASASAKDIITKTDGTKLDAKVEEITETLIKYRKASNPTGPIYTIAIESVDNIAYENGEVEKFNESSVAEFPIQGSTNYLSDDDLIRMSASQDASSQTGGVSDVQLMRMAYTDTADGLLIKKAKTYRNIGWIGGGAIFLVGIGGSLLTLTRNSDYIASGGLTVLGSSIVVASVWSLGFNLKANSLMKQAREMQSYSINIIENDIIKFGYNSLTAGINIMGNRLVNSHSLGLSLGFNF